MIDFYLTMMIIIFYKKEKIMLVDLHFCTVTDGCRR